MTNLNRVRVEWVGGGVVGNGVSTFYVADPASTWTSAITAFFTAVRANVTTDVTWLIPNSGDTIDDATGELVGSWTEGTPGSVTGQDAGAYAAGVGSRISWRTAGFTRGRRVRGTTFLCPLGAGAYDNNGGMNVLVTSIQQDAADDLVTALGGNLRIWSRPITGSGGTSHAVTSALAPPVVSWLKSRRT